MTFTTNTGTSQKLLFPTDILWQKKTLTLDGSEEKPGDPTKRSKLRSGTNTPRKTNMEPENEPLEEEIPIRNHHFQVPC